MRHLPEYYVGKEFTWDGDFVVLGTSENGSGDDGFVVRELGTDNLLWIENECIDDFVC